MTTLYLSYHLTSFTIASLPRQFFLQGNLSLGDSPPDEARLCRVPRVHWAAEHPGTPVKYGFSSSKNSKFRREQQLGLPSRHYLCAPPCLRWLSLIELYLSRIYAVDEPVRSQALSFLHRLVYKRSVSMHCVAVGLSRYLISVLHPCIHPQMKFSFTQSLVMGAIMVASTVSGAVIGRQAGVPWCTPGSYDFGTEVRIVPLSRAASVTITYTDWRNGIRSVKNSAEGPELVIVAGNHDLNWVNKLVH